MRPQNTTQDRKRKLLALSEKASEVKNQHDLRVDVSNEICAVYGLIEKNDTLDNQAIKSTISTLNSHIQEQNNIDGLANTEIKYSELLHNLIKNVHVKHTNSSSNAINAEILTALKDNSARYLNSKMNLDDHPNTSEQRETKIPKIALSANAHSATKSADIETAKEVGYSK